MQELNLPEIPPGYRSEHCDRGGKYLSPNPQHFCICDYAHVPVKRKIEKEKFIKLCIKLLIIQTRKDILLERILKSQPRLTFTQTRYVGKGQ